MEQVQYLTQQQQQWIDAIRADILAEAARVEALPPDVSMEDSDAALATTHEVREVAWRLVQSIDSGLAANAVHDALTALQAELEQIVPMHVGTISVVERVEVAEAEYRQASDDPYYTTANFAFFDARVGHALGVFYRDNAAGRPLLVELAGSRDGDCRTGLVYKVVTRGEALAYNKEFGVKLPNRASRIEVLSFPNNLPIAELNRW